VDNPADASFKLFFSVRDEEPGDILQAKEAGASVSQDASGLGPEVSVVGEQLSLSGNGMALAGYSGNDCTHFSSESVCWKGVKVSADSRTIQGRTFHPRHENRRGVGVPLDVTNTSRVESACCHRAVKSSIEHSDAGTEGDIGK
jgi:hypothetical protein